MNAKHAGFALEIGMNIKAKEFCCKGLFNTKDADFMLYRLE